MTAQIAIQPADVHNDQLVANVHPADWTNPTPKDRYNLVVIGAGSAGLITAAIAAGLGARVALVERHLMGGDCLNVGCVPSKSLIRAARTIAEARQAEATRRVVPGGEGKHSVEVNEAGGALALEQLDQHLRVGRAAPREARQAASQLRVVVDLAVEYDGRAARAAGHGLRTRGSRIEDGETPVGKAQLPRVAGDGEGLQARDALSVRPAVRQLARHRTQPLLFDAPAPQHAGDSAHG